ncbi:hypothetical protein HanXRQr2_Chr13g0596851 [Helianthus annuus]|uniref:Uncharacterized protein n=1 Tax=Helianthus annuus TaxID=4232 RepID=A0A9K3EJ43_HELAN|nr:hypothetical protein HanXRQr2_Chr13g0596851 [Helianthus annuus]KAJ0849947.1 hypothetical protein HanPSC8_Chr13g0574851 [Helianthus annuus]
MMKMEIQQTGYQTPAYLHRQNPKCCYRIRLIYRRHHQPWYFTCESVSGVHV